MSTRPDMVRVPHEVTDHHSTHQKGAKSRYAAMFHPFLVTASAGASELVAPVGIGIIGVVNRTRIRVGLVFGLFEAGCR